MSDAAAERMRRALVAASLRAPRASRRRMSKLFVEDSMDGNFEDLAIATFAAALAKQVNQTRSLAPTVINVDHLIDACGEDPRRLAGLALIMATSSYGLGAAGLMDRAALDQVEVYQRAVVEIQKRLRWAMERKS